MKNIYSLFIGMAISLLAIPISVISQVSVPSNFQVEEFANVNNPIGMHFDTAGNLLFVEFNSSFSTVIKEVSIANGQNMGVSSLTGSFNAAQYIDLDAVGNIYTAQPARLDGDILKISPDGTSITAFIPGAGGNDTRGVVFDGDGNLFASNTIITAQDNTVDGFITKFLIDGAGNYLSQINSFISPFPLGNSPVDLAVDDQNNLFIASGNTVSKVTFDANGNVDVFDINFAILPNPNNTTAIGLGINSCGELYVTQITFGDNTGGNIFRITENGDVLPFASGLYQPRDIVFDDDNKMYVSDFTRDKIYRISSVNGNTNICFEKQNIPCVNNVVCKDQVTVILEADGMKTVTPAMVLDGQITPNCTFSVEILTGSFRSYVDCSDIGSSAVYQVSVATQNGSQASVCWGYIIVEDKTAPSITCPPAATVDCEADLSPAALGKAVGEDNCEVFFSYSDLENPMGCQTIITRTWTASDPGGISTSCDQEVTVLPAPANIIWPDNLEVECKSIDLSNSETTYPPSETGSPDVETCGQVSISFTDQVYQNTNGTIIQRKWIVEDLCLGGIEEHLQVLTLVDTKGPMILSAPDVELFIGPFFCGAPASYPAPVVEDACSEPGDITLSYDPPAGTILSLGETIVTLTATDPAGNSSSTNFTASVKDGIAPNANCDNGFNISIGPDGTAQVTLDNINESSSDNCDPNPALKISRPNPSPDDEDDQIILTCKDAGATIPITLTVTDASGNTNQCQTEVTVTDKGGICPPAFVNQRTGEGSDSWAAVYAAAQDGDVIEVNRDMIDALNLDEDKKVILTTPSGSDIQSLFIGTLNLFAGTLETQGTAAIKFGDVNTDETLDATDLIFLNIAGVEIENLVVNSNVRLQTETALVINNVDLAGGVTWDLSGSGATTVKGSINTHHLDSLDPIQVNISGDGEKSFEEVIIADESKVIFMQDPQRRTPINIKRLRVKKLAELALYGDYNTDDIDLEDASLEFCPGATTARKTTVRGNSKIEVSAVGDLSINLLNLETGATFTLIAPDDPGNPYQSPIELNTTKVAPGTKMYREKQRKTTSAKIIVTREEADSPIGTASIYSEASLEIAKDLELQNNLEVTLAPEAVLQVNNRTLVCAGRTLAIEGGQFRTFSVINWCEWNGVDETAKIDLFQTDATFDGVVNLQKFQIEFNEGATGRFNGSIINGGDAPSYGNIVLEEGARIIIGPDFEGKSIPAVIKDVKRKGNTLELYNSKNPGDYFYLDLITRSENPVPDVFDRSTGGQQQTVDEASADVDLPSPYYTKVVRNFKVTDEENNPIVDLKLPIDLVDAPELANFSGMPAVPFIAIKDETEQIHYYPADEKKGFSLTTEGEVPNVKQKIVSATVEKEGAMATFYCPLDNNQRSSKDPFVKVCIKKSGQTWPVKYSTALKLIAMGNYCGECNESAVAVQGTSLRLDAIQRVDEAFSIFPNPVSDELTIVFDREAVGTRLIRLLDMNGRMLRQLEVAPDTPMERINVEGLPRGLYTLQVQDGLMSRTEKVVVE